MRQGKRWRSEVDAELAGPMARGADGQDYFVHELALGLVHDVLVPVMITRWFERHGALFAQVHPVRLTSDGAAYVIDARQEKMFDIALNDLKVSVVELEKHETHSFHHLPHPNHIEGILS